MSSSSADNDSGAEEATINGGEVNGGNRTPTREEGGNGRPSAPRIVELLEEARDDPPTPDQLGSRENRYRAVQHIATPSEDGSFDALPRRAGSPIDSLLSVPDDSPSVQVGSAAYAEWHSLTYYIGLSTFFARGKQYPTIRRLQTRSRKPNSFLPALRQTIPVPPLLQPLRTPRLLSLPQHTLTHCFSQQPTALTRLWGHRHTVSAMGSCTMD